MSLRSPLLSLVSLAAILLCGSACDDPPASSIQGAEPPLAERIEAGWPSYAQPRSSSGNELSDLTKLLGQGQLEEALQGLRQAANSDSSGEAWFLVGYVHQQRQQYGLALEPYERSFACGPGFPKAAQLFYLWGRCLQEEGQLEAARAAYHADGQLNSTQGDGPFRLALIEFELGDTDSSEANAREALARFSTPKDQAKVHAHLADLALARGDADAARKALETCVALFPHYEAFYKLSRVCARLGDEQAAKKYLEQHAEWRKRAGR